MTRSKSSLPLTRFVAPKRLGGSNDQNFKSNAATSSLTPVEEEETMRGTDDTAENEEVENAVTNTDRIKRMDTSGSMVEAVLDTPVSDDSPDPTPILEAVQALHEDFIKHQENFEEFVNEANTRIIKLETAISTQTMEDEIKCRKGIQDLKDLMANTYKHSSSSGAIRYESALSFNDFDNQQSRTRSHLSRFTQLDSEDESASPATIDPSLLQRSKSAQDPRSPVTSPGPSSQTQPSNPLEDQEGNMQQNRQEPAEQIPAFGSPEMMNLDDVGPDVWSSPPAPPPPASSPSAIAAAARLMSLAEPQFAGDSSPASPPQATRPEQPETPTQVTQPAEATQATEATQFTRLTLPSQSPLHNSTNPTAHAPLEPTKRPRRSATLPVRAEPLPDRPVKKQKSNKSIKKPPATKKKSTGPQGSLPVGTLKKSKGVTRVKGARWPPSGPNTVIGLGGFIECESCLGPVHRSCAGLMDEEEIPNMSWICPDCDYVEETNGTKLPLVKDTGTCVRPNCVRRSHKKVVWKPSDAELYIIKQAIGPLQPARSLSNGKFEYLTEWIGYPLNESTWEPIESFVAADEMASQFVVAAEAQGWDLEEMGDGVVLLKEAMAAFGADGELRLTWGRCLWYQSVVECQV